MNNQTLISELKIIGFTKWVHLDKNKRDGMHRWIWTFPIEKQKEWFTVRLVKEQDNLKIDKIFNPLGKSFEVNDISYEDLKELSNKGPIELIKEYFDGEKSEDDFEEKAFYDILLELCKKYDFTYPEAKLIELSKRVKDLVDSQSKFPDRNKREDIKAALKVGLILLLDEFGYPPVERDEVYGEIFTQAENYKRHSKV